MKNHDKPWNRPASELTKLEVLAALFYAASMMCEDHDDVEGFYPFTNSARLLLESCEQQVEGLPEDREPI